MIKIKSRFVSRDEGYVFLPNPSQWIMNSFYSLELIEDKKFKTFRRDFFLDILLPPPPSCKILARKFKRQVWDTKHLSPLSDTLYKAFISPESSFEAFCKVWRNTKGYLSKAWTFCNAGRHQEFIPQRRKYAYKSDSCFLFFNNKREDIYKLNNTIVKLWTWRDQWFFFLSIQTFAFVRVDSIQFTIIFQSLEVWM